MNFKHYISQPDSSTIPLTFNLRKDLKKHWCILPSNRNATLRLSRTVPCLAQVDCQHRLGELQDEDIPLAFMAFIGLDLRSEMAMFTIINSKARGLSSSLTDYHRSNLIDDLAAEVPELFIARRLNEDPKSPWFRLIRYGGKSTSGLKRKTSLRMMQKAIRRFLNQTRYLQTHEPASLLTLLLDYWHSVANVFDGEWRNHRSSLITKGVGLYALTQLLGTVVAKFKDRELTEAFFADVLTPLKTQLDWGTHGTFSNAGGHKGANEAHATLKRLLKL
jgi:DGQHR domain-containing protein